jgi:hypothetical protein
MWLFTNTGFVSAVSNGKDLMVRARDKESLEPLAEITKQALISTPTNDYPYRLIISHEIFAKWVSHMATGITYKNFKSEVAATRGYDFAHPLMKVWSAMHEVEDSGAGQTNEFPKTIGGL